MIDSAVVITQCHDDIALHQKNIIGITLNKKNDVFDSTDIANSKLTFNLDTPHSAPIFTLAMSPKRLRSHQTLACSSCGGLT